MPQRIRLPALMVVRETCTAPLRSCLSIFTSAISLQCLILGISGCTLLRLIAPYFFLQTFPYPLPDGQARPRFGRPDLGSQRDLGNVPLSLQPSSTAGYPRLRLGPFLSQDGQPLLPHPFHPRLPPCASYQPHPYALGVAAASSRAARSFQALVYAARTGRVRFPNAVCAASAWPSRRPARLYAADAARPRWRRGRRRGW